VTDFGLAKRGGGYDLTVTGAVMGTPAYMAPEQAIGNGKWVGPSADVYALGAVLYECLTGRPPFDATDSVALLNQVVTADPPPPRRFVPSVPRDLELICLKCLAKFPSERYPSAAALAADLTRFANREPVSVRPAGRLEKAVKWVRRHPGRATIYGLTGTAAALLGLTLGVLDLWRAAAAARTAAEGDRGTAERALAQAHDAARREAETGEQLAVLSSARAVELANREFGANDAGRTREALAACRPDLRFWEWRYLDRATRRAVAVVPTGRRVTGVGFTPDGRLFTWGDAGLVRRDADLARPTPIDSAGWRGGALSADGRRVAFSGTGNRVTVLDAATNAVVWSAGPGYESVALSPDGGRVALAEHTTAAAVAFSADGTRLATAGHDRAVRWPCGTPRPAAKFCPCAAGAAESPSSASAPTAPASSPTTSTAWSRPSTPGRSDGRLCLRPTRPIIGMYALSYPQSSGYIKLSPCRASIRVGAADGSVLLRRPVRVGLADR